jgi:hypothetical protein
LDILLSQERIDMFFVPNVPQNAFPILEVGPGANPYEYSDVWLDYDFDDTERFKQSGQSRPATGRPLVFYKGGKFPFKNKAFEYVVASHVLEHINWEDIPKFISELERISKAGYIELPRWAYELINLVPEHISSGSTHDGRLHIYKKEGIHEYHKVTNMLMQFSGKFREYVVSEREFYFCKYEWVGRIDYEMHENEDVTTLGDDSIKVKMADDLKGTRVASPLTNAYGVGASLFSKIKKRFAILGKGNQLINRKKELPLDIGKIRQLLECPECGGGIDIKMHCTSCDFNFKVDGLECRPRGL